MMRAGFGLGVWMLACSLGTARLYRVLCRWPAGPEGMAGSGPLWLGGVVPAGSELTAGGWLRPAAATRVGGPGTRDWAAVGSLPYVKMPTAHFGSEPMEEVSTGWRERS